jgi:hypothetical protein
MKTTATLNGRLGTLRFTVVGYEFPDVDSGEDGNWLVARVEWDSDSSKASHQGPILQTQELRALAAALSEGESDVEHALLEPDFALRLAPGRATITLSDEVCGGVVRFEVTSPVDAADVIAFGEGLRRIAELFPPRQAHPACLGLAAA